MITHYPGSTVIKFTVLSLSSSQVLTLVAVEKTWSMLLLSVLVVLIVFWTEFLFAGVLQEGLAEIIPYFQYIWGLSFVPRVIALSILLRATFGSLWPFSPLKPVLTDFGKMDFSSRRPFLAYLSYVVGFMSLCGQETFRYYFKVFSGLKGFDLFTVEFRAGNMVLP